MSNGNLHNIKMHKKSLFHLRPFVCDLSSTLMKKNSPYLRQKREKICKKGYENCKFEKIKLG